MESNLFKRENLNSSSPINTALICFSSVLQTDFSPKKAKPPSAWFSAGVPLTPSPGPAHSTGEVIITSTNEAPLWALHTCETRGARLDGYLLVHKRVPETQARLPPPQTPVPRGRPRGPRAPQAPLHIEASLQVPRTPSSSSVSVEEEEQEVKEGVLRLLAMSVEVPGCCAHREHGRGFRRRQGNQPASEKVGGVGSTALS